MRTLRRFLKRLTWWATRQRDEERLQAETRSWEQTAAIIGRFFAAKAEDLK